MIYAHYNASKFSELDLLKPQKVQKRGSELRDSDGYDEFTCVVAKRKKKDCNWFLRNIVITLFMKLGMYYVVGKYWFGKTTTGGIVLKVDYI